MSVAALPRVSGRHRNKALAAARRSRAVELRTQGWSYEAIAEEMGYANRGTVYAIVRQALANQEAEEVQYYRQVEMDRLDRLTFALQESIEAGDVRAITEARRIIEARVRLLGLLDTVGKDAAACRTVVCSCAPGTGHQLTGVPVLHLV